MHKVMQFQYRYAMHCIFQLIDEAYMLLHCTLIYHHVHVYLDNHVMDPDAGGFYLCFICQHFCWYHWKRSVSLVCGYAFLTKIPWCITSQSLLKVGPVRHDTGRNCAFLGILSFSVISIYQLKTYNFHQYYLYMILMESVSALFMFG